MSTYTFALDDSGGYEVRHDRLGTIGRLARSCEKPGGRTLWRPVTTTGIEGAEFDARHPAAVWLHTQVDPEYFKPRPTVDPVLATIHQYLERDDADQALRTVLERICEDLHDMRQRRRTNPAALWRHLDRYSTWLTAVGVGENPSTNLPARLAHLQLIEAG